MPHTSTSDHAVLRMQTKKLSVLALLGAIGYLSMFCIKFQLFGFLSYEPKDIFITLAGFLYGPLSALILSVVTSILELPISSTGVIGCLMNVLSSAAFACTASLLYQKRRTLSGAVFGLVSGVCAMTVTMLLWNYLITPLYLQVERQVVVGMLTSVFLPFNLIKAAINASIIMLIYKPFTRILRQTHLLEDRSASPSTRFAWMVPVWSLLILGGCVFLVLFLNGVLPTS